MTPDGSSKKRVSQLRPRDWSRQPAAYAPEYKSTLVRSPRRKLIQLVDTDLHNTGPIFNNDDLGANDWDLLTNFAQPDKSAIGPRIFIQGRVLDENRRPVPNTLIEIWQANSGGRYRHKTDTYLAPIDPNFGGCGRTLTDDQGQYRFRTVQPGAYPWPNGPNTWRPAHIHFSLFGHAFAQRLITQCYFEGDPLIPHCAIIQTISDQRAVNALTAKLDLEATVPHDTIAYRFDIVLRGKMATPFEDI